MCFHLEMSPPSEALCLPRNRLTIATPSPFSPHVAVVVFIIIHSDLERFSPRVIQSGQATSKPSSTRGRSRTDGLEIRADGREEGRAGLSWGKSRTRIISDKDLRFLHQVRLLISQEPVLIPQQPVSLLPREKSWHNRIPLL